MLVMNLGDECIGGNYKMFLTGLDHVGHRNPLSLYITVGHQHSKDVTTGDSPASKFSRQDPEIINFKSLASRCHQHHFYHLNGLTVK